MKSFVALIFVTLLIYGLKIGAVTAIPLFWLLLFIFLNWFRQKTTPSVFKDILTFVVFGLGVVFAMHLLGFHNIKCDSIQFSANSIPETSYFNFDKILSGLILLYFYHNPWVFSRTLFQKTFLISFVGILFIIGFAIYPLHFITFDFKIHETILIWSLRNFFAVALCEELLFRGLLQESLTSMFLRCLNKKWASFLALTLASILFGLFYYRSGSAMIFLAIMAGFFYGWVYLKTNHIFYSTLAHFTLNLIHFICFTYPCLMR